MNEETVLFRIKNFLGENCCEKRKNYVDNQGPDLIVNKDNKKYYIEAIGFKETGKGRNQSNFWKAFAQAISRLNPNSKWGKPDNIVIALPDRFKDGWSQRVKIHGKEIWQRIGGAFPELEIWFVGEYSIEYYSWNDAFINK